MNSKGAVYKTSGDIPNNLSPADRWIEHLRVLHPEGFGEMTSENLRKAAESTGFIVQDIDKKNPSIENTALGAFFARYSAVADNLGAKGDGTKGYWAVALRSTANKFCANVELVEAPQPEA